MSAHHDLAAHAAGHGHHDQHDHGHHGDDGHDHGSVKSYTIGFLLSVILTAIPFWLVMGNVFESSSTTAMAILALGAVQIVVHMVYFLHMNSRSEGGWTMLAFLFTLVLLVITLAGSIWVMYHLNHNMMPGMTADSPHQIHDMP
ncbi:MAG TPA: cytochrome o ubiquinol oxidase subunit IV [Noviherbaspirillum sp.]|uniref:cytochrome o ubiquinol oxidase subunit IV n=1 Tax=Noviherbaspirillum sp. TaxID=1926288 RepID=UPI002F93316F